MLPIFTGFAKAAEAPGGGDLGEGQIALKALVLPLTRHGPKARRIIVVIYTVYQSMLLVTKTPNRLM